MEKRPDGKEQRNRSGGSGKRKEPEKRVGSGKRILVEKSDVLTKQIVRSLSGLRKMTAERISPPILIGGVVFAAVLIGIILFMGRGNNTEAAEVSAGQKDNIKGFMFIFDKRSVQQRLVEDMKEGRIPLKLTCEKFDLIPNEDGTVSENIDESVYNLAGGAGSRRGTGGMKTKLQAADLATGNGIHTLVTNGKNPEILYEIFDGNKIGTLFVGKK